MAAAIPENIQRISAGAVVACFVVLTQLATRDCFHIAHLIAIGCFSATMPIFVAAITIPKYQKLEDDSPWGGAVSQIMGWTGVVFLLGVASLLWSFRWYFAVLFATISYACYYAVRKVP